MPQKFTIDVSDECLAILHAEGIDDHSEWIRKFLTRQLLNVKRTLREAAHTKLMWNRELHAALVSRLGHDDIAAYVRESVYGELKEFNVMRPPDWKTVRRKQRADATASAKDSESDAGENELLHPVKIPQDWIETIREEKCPMVSTYIMACVQNRIQRETGELYPAKNTMRKFLTSYRTVSNR